MFFEAGSIDLLIGGDSFFDLLDLERVNLGVDTLRLQSSKFGWIVTGKMNSVCLLRIDRGIEDNFRNQGIIKDDEYVKASENNLKCLEERQTLDHFRATARRNSESRFVLRLPFKALHKSAI